MTLKLALEQIQRPSWWSENDPPEYKYMRHGKASGPVKKSNVLAHIRANGRRSDAALLVKLTGYTIQSIRYVTGKLIEDGLIRRVPRSDNRVLWEAVK